MLSDHRAPNPKPKSTEIGLREFIGLISAAMALTAIAIDTMLPAFGDIRQAFGFAADSTKISLIVTAFFVGMATGQFAYGPLSDRIGRKGALRIGLGIYIIGAIGATFAPTFGFLIASRIVWGIGAAGPRVVAIAILRDRYSGDHMARVMLFVQAVFMIVPILAPVWGQLWLSVGSWRWTFGQAIVLAALLALWSIRLPETLTEANKQSLRLKDIARSIGQITRNRQTVGMALAQTLLFGAFLPWLGSSELIIGEIYDRKDIYVAIFAGSAVFMAIAVLISTKAVQLYGAHRVARAMLVSFVIASALALVLVLQTDGLPSFWVFVVVITILVSLQTSITPNVAALAMEPMGHIAGVASSAIGTVTIAGGAFLGYLVDSRIEETVTPVLLGMVGYGAIALVCVTWASKDTASDT